MISKLNCCGAIASLVNYACDKKLLDQADQTWAINRLLAKLKLEAFEKGGEELPFPACLKLLCDYAVENDMIEDTVTERDILDTDLMDVLTPRPSEVAACFRAKYATSAREATDYFYQLSNDSNYIRRDRIARDMHWVADSKYGELEISINLSKPEKDPKEIAAAKERKSSGYPACQLCVENEGYEGNLSHPARSNHRIVPIEICGEPWGFQYSPYVYFNEHCIVLNTKHEPMVIDESAFRKLLSFVSQFPHYFLGSNADLPIVGGSILSHEHFQGGCHSFPMEKAEKEFAFTVPGFEDVDCAVLKYPMTVLRLSGVEAERLVKLAARILQRWRGYTDEACYILSETEGIPHNTITPIARMNQGKYELDLVLRNNITNDKHILGEYHPHEELHHIKKENIGLIEVMGLAILPGRLKGEMEALKATLLAGKDPAQDAALQKHADWVKEFMPRHPEWSVETADEILQREIGSVFEKVLECAGVYKCTKEGREGLKRFIAAI